MGSVYSLGDALGTGLMQQHVTVREGAPSAENGGGLMGIDTKKHEETLYHIQRPTLSSHSMK